MNQTASAETPKNIVKGYKVTKPDMSCRGFQYELGKYFHHVGRMELCDRGLHFCRRINHCFNYYNFDPNNRVFEIEAWGTVIDGDDKSVADNIRLVREIPWEEVLVLSNAGVGNTGHSNTGYWNTGYRNTGDRNTGDRNTGDSNTGDRNTGDSNTGDSNTGYSNTGDSNTGNWNTGYRNTGYRNTGDRNTGYSNTGDRNTGNWNTGDRNTGYSNTGDRNTGLFCTQDAPFPIFDQPSDWTEDKFLESEVYTLLLQVDTKQWVPGHLMTDSEKKANRGWKAAEGFVRDITFKQAFQDRWHNWSKESRDEFIKLPNFDAKKFEHITGVKV